MRTLHRLAAVTTALVLGLSACKDSTGNNNGGDGGLTDTSGSVSFQYAGFTAGSFATSGTAPTAVGNHPQFAAAQRDTAQGQAYIVLLGFQQRATGRTDLIDLEMAEPAGPATLSLADTCGTDTSIAGCAFAFVGLNWDLSTSSSLPDEQSYGVDAGSVQITSVSSTRIRGTFSAHALDESGHAITISAGSFDVPFVHGNAFFNRSPAVSGPSLLRLHR
ncbi:MAG TPA: hypothetical protein VFH27_14455 [Longimicrobiaceae bacterium]|nr:hypothetical protein [Longimicrobiaceae bacterium]